MTTAAYVLHCKHAASKGHCEMFILRVRENRDSATHHGLVAQTLFEVLCCASSRILPKKHKSALGSSVIWRLCMQGEHAITQWVSCLCWGKLLLCGWAVTSKNWSLLFSLKVGFRFWASLWPLTKYKADCQLLALWKSFSFCRTDWLKIWAQKAAVC